MANDRPKLELSGPQIIGGALAAASAAVAASWLGVAGTVLGAVIVSLVASIGSALYTHSLERSSSRDPRVAARQSRSGRFADARRGGRRSRDRGAAARRDTGCRRRRPPESSGAARRAPASGRSRGAPSRVSALASLALAAAVLTGFETFVGKPASSITGAGDDGGTTVSQLVGNGSSTARTRATRSHPTTPTRNDVATAAPAVEPERRRPAGSAQPDHRRVDVGPARLHADDRTDRRPSDSDRYAAHGGPSTPNADAGHSSHRPAPTD